VRTWHVDSVVQGVASPDCVCQEDAGKSTGVLWRLLQPQDVISRCQTAHSEDMKAGGALLGRSSIITERCSSTSRLFVVGTAQTLSIINPHLLGSSVSCLELCARSHRAFVLLLLSRTDLAHKRAGYVFSAVLTQMTALLHRDCLSMQQEQQLMKRSSSVLAQCYRRGPPRISRSLVSARSAAAHASSSLEGCSGRALPTAATAAGDAWILPLARHGAISRSAFGRQWSRLDVCRAAGAMGLHARSKQSSVRG
jgi:hypothetical protein